MVNGNALLLKMRHLRVIKTDNMGDIEIRKRTKPSYTLKLLRELRVMLTKDAVESDVIITIGQALRLTNGTETPETRVTVAVLAVQNPGGPKTADAIGGFIVRRIFPGFFPVR